MKRSVFPGVVALTVLAAGAAQAQQTVTQTPPTVTNPDFATAMKTLEQRLRSAGSIHTVVTVTNQQTGKVDGSAKVFQEDLQGTTAEAATCVLHAPLPVGLIFHPHGDYYLEEISDVQVHALAGEPRMYEVASVFPLFRFAFATQETAQEVADLLHQVAQQCCARPPTTAQGTGGGPNLAETLKFVTDKIGYEGTLNWVVSSTNPSQSFSYSYGQSASVPSSGTCALNLAKQIRSDGQKPNLSIGGYPLSLRRVAQIEVLPFVEAQARRNDKDGSSYTAFRRDIKNQISVPIFVARITTPAGGWRDLIFQDEALANRVAKAMVHAAELCGAGANSEPF
jgi:hypothetical protein